MAANRRPSPTPNPVAHGERVEFGAPGWIDVARAYLEPRVAAAGNSIAGQRFAICEVYTDAPPHLGCPDNVAAMHIVIDDGHLTVGAGELDDVDVKARADYNRAHIVSTSVDEALPDRKARVQRELAHRDGDVFEVKGTLSLSPEMTAVVSGAHDHLARRTVPNPDTGHRVRHLGLDGHARRLDEDGYTVLEGAFSDALADELTDDLRRLMSETTRGRAASMLVERGLLWEELAVHPWVHTLAQYLVGPDCNLAQSLGFAKRAGEDTHKLHNDPPHPVPGTRDVCFNMTTIWALEDFTETSGSTVLVPGSHKLNRQPDPDARDKAVTITMPRGSVAVWHGASWHGAAVREDPGERLTIHNTYTRNIARTFDSYLYIDPEVVARNAPALTTLCGLDDIYEKNSYDGPDLSRYR